MNREFDDQDVTGRAGRVVTGCTVDCAHYAVGKRFRVEAGRSLSVLIVPEANRVLAIASPFDLKPAEQIDAFTGPSKYPPAKPGALRLEPLKAALWGR
jgi:hypothetical protein